ncbi:MAG TPA: hypothetical protein PLL88_00280 [Anaerolineaceae bacterium]|jgi:hypothetical protein|nr:hypothetical protein [Anaerolineaceae bacterium]
MSSKQSRFYFHPNFSRYPFANSRSFGANTYTVLRQRGEQQLFRPPSLSNVSSLWVMEKIMLDHGNRVQLVDVFRRSERLKANTPAFQAILKRAPDRTASVPALSQ